MIAYFKEIIEIKNSNFDYYDLDGRVRQYLNKVKAYNADLNVLFKNQMPKPFHHYEIKGTAYSK